MKIKVGISNRHVHLTKDVYYKLFGSEEMKKYKDLVQPGEYATTSYVTIKKGNYYIEKVRVLGPFRNYTQVEISRSDAYKLKANPPIRTSGDVANSDSITIIGPNGKVDLNEGLILAKRHIHICPKDMKKYELEKNKTASVLINGCKGGIINNIELKILENAELELHLDIDEANAFDLKNGDCVKLINDTFKYND